MKTYELKLKVNVVSEEENIDKKVDALISKLFKDNDCLTTGVVTQKREIKLNFLKQDTINDNAFNFIKELHNKANINYEQIKCCVADKHSNAKICYINIYNNNEMALKITHFICGATFVTEDGWYCDCLRFIINEYQKGFYDKIKKYVTIYINNYKRGKLIVTQEVNLWME